MRIQAIVIVVLALICSCQHKQQPMQPVVKAYSSKAPLDDRKLINRLLDSATQQGNDRAYAEVASYHLLESQGEEFLYYALIMANKYNDPLAHYHIYYILTSPRTGETLKQLDPKTKAFAVYHLLKSYELGEESGMYQVKEIFGEGKPIPKSSDYLQELVKAEQSQK